MVQVHAQHHRNVGDLNWRSVVRVFLQALSVVRRKLDGTVNLAVHRLTNESIRLIGNCKNPTCVAL